METHDGVVILASNLPRVLDTAFLRRILYTVEFPAPDDALRLRLWAGMLGDTPAAAGVDVAFLARQFKLTGGQIRNAVLHAAYAAAGNGRRVTTEAIVRAIAGQFLKEGRSPSAADFKQYYELIAPGLRHAGQNV
jgi:ATP-dependent 26S proteasome regulatory subunit